MILENATTGCAVGALACPWWAPILHDTVAYWVLPLLGATWLAVQIYYKIKNKGLS